MILNSNSRPTALVGGLCSLRTGLHSYEETLASIIFQDGVIKEIIKLKDTDIDKHISEIKSRYKDLLIVRLYSLENPCYVFPGLVDIHNHIDYNMMPIWERPVEQPWDNRHEWRNCTQYTDDIKNLYHYIFDHWNDSEVIEKNDKALNEDASIVIQFLSELQAIAGGTTTLQESTEISYSKNGKPYSHSAEHILLRSTGVSEDMGLDTEQKINSIIDFYKPNIEEIKKAYESSGIPKDKYFHPPIDTSTWQTNEVINGKSKMSFVNEYLKSLDKSDSVIDNKTNQGGYLVHLAEGRAGNLRSGEGLGHGMDAYSKKEFGKLKGKISGHEDKIADSRLTLIHGCGINLQDNSEDSDVKFINDCSIRVVWSPVSNLLLYEDTPDYLNSKIRPELICLGSDWAPSGSKHIWDEAKFAQDFAIKYVYHGSAPKNINDIFLDMISYIPAQAVGSDKLGRIAEGCYADFYIVSRGRKLPKQDMDATISDVFKKFSDYESVGTIINGNLIFGTKELFDLFGLKESKIASLEKDMEGISADEGAKNLRVRIPEIQFIQKDTQSGETVEVHIDFDDAIHRLNKLFDGFNKKNKKKFVRSKLLSSYDIPYKKQISRLRKKFNLD